MQNKRGGSWKVDSEGPTMSGCSRETCDDDCNTQNASTLGCTE